MTLANLSTKPPSSEGIQGYEVVSASDPVDSGFGRVIGLENRQPGGGVDG